MDNLEYKSTPGRIEVKEDGKDSRLHIRAYALAFNNADSYGDVIMPTACDAWLSSDEAARTALCYQHDMSDVIGVITDKGVDAYGMWFEADILPTSEGKDVQILMKAGAISEFSIGYYVVNAHYDIREEKELRILDEIRVIEISPVTRAANAKAVMIDMKADMVADGLRLTELSDARLEQLKSDIDEEILKRTILIL